MRGGGKKDRSEGRLKRKNDGKEERERLKWDAFSVTIKPLIHDNVQSEN
jgi:hypothetical protein